MAEDLRFDKAEYTGTAAGSSCTQCGQGLGLQYYEHNGNAICSRCRSRIEREMSGGSRLGRVVRATALGFLVGALGTAIWYGVRALTGYEFGLIAVFVGLGVGGAVRVGSNGRGGWGYQALAMFLTYGSIVSTYVPDIIEAIRTQGEPGAVAAAAKGEDATLGAEPVEQATLVPVDAETSDVVEPGEPVQQMSLGNGLLAVSVAGLFLLALAFALPFLGGVQNIMGIIIIGIALYEAWKMNKKVPLAITGPYRLAAGSRPPAIGA